LEWSLEDVGVGVATAASAMIGAFVADRFGFNLLFVMYFICGLISVSILLSLGQIKKSIIKELFRRPGDKAPLKIDGIK